MTLNRLLAAVLLCFAVVFSQMVHADVSTFDDPAPSHAASEAKGPPVVEGDGHPHASAEEASSVHEHGGKADSGNCANKCPASFVPANGGGTTGAWAFQTKRVAFDTALKGSLVALSERPPRA